MLLFLAGTSTSFADNRATDVRASETTYIVDASNFLVQGNVIDYKHRVVCRKAGTCAIGIGNSARGLVFGKRAKNLLFQFIVKVIALFSYNFCPVHSLVRIWKVGYLSCFI